jgi:hypothetical protein
MSVKGPQTDFFFSFRVAPVVHRCTFNASFLYYPFASSLTTMRLTSLIGLASAVTTAMAHATVFGVWVNGVDQGDGQNRYVRKSSQL